jgi:hypothetical protein
MKIAIKLVWCSNDLAYQERDRFENPILFGVTGGQNIPFVSKD